MPGARSTARRYAEAAFEIAEADGTLAAWRDALTAARDLLGDPELLRVLANPAIPAATRQGILAQVAGERITGKPRRLLELLIERGRIERLPDVVREFGRLVAQREGISEATITSAAPLDEAEVAALRERVAAMTGGRVEVTLAVDPTLLGGVRIRVGDTLIDGSVRGRLERLRGRLEAGAL
jgi:F-type H+-transporting ATPase subunit delta